MALLEASSEADDFLAGGGEMGALMRAHDWTTSPLGAPSTWPQSLRSVVGLMINSRYPMFVAWGPELAFLYNDGYAPIFGAKHPHMLGVPFKQAWSEIWDDIWPLIERALAGEATYHENLHLVMERNGYPEDTWYSFSYSPVRDESGAVAGMFCACTETTQQVLAERRQAFRLALGERLRDLADPEAIKRAAAEALGRHLRAARAGYAELEADDAHTSIEGEWREEGVASVSGRHNLGSYGAEFEADYRAGRSVVIDDFETDERSSGRPAAVAHAAVGVRAQIAVPLIKEGGLAAILFVHSAAERRWSEEDAELAREVAERTWDAVERARAEAALRDSVARLREQFENANDFIFTADLNMRVTACNPAVAAALGHAPEELIGRSISEFVPPGMWERNKAMLAAKLDGGQDTTRYEVDVFAPGGGLMTWEINSRLTHDAAGTPTGLHAIGRDVTEDRQAEEALRESEARYRTLFDSIDEGFCIIEFLDGPNGPLSDYVHVEANPAYALHAGIEDVVGQRVREMVPGEADGWVELYGRVLRTGEPIRFERELVATGRHLELAAFRLEPPSRRQVAVLFRDFTARRRAEAELAAARAAAEAEAAERAAILGQLSEGVIVTDLEGRIVFVNEAATQLHGVAALDVAPEAYSETYHLFRESGEPYPFEELPLARAVMHGEKVVDARWRIRRPDGSEVVAIGSAQPIRDADGKQVGAVLTVSDDTLRHSAEQALRELNETLEHRVEERTAELVQAQDALRQSQKMEAIGQLTGGVAHDFNNLLTVIRGSADLLRRPELSEERRRKYVDAIADTADRAARLTSQLLAFARRQALKPEIFDVGERVRAMVEMIRTVIGAGIEIDLELGEGCHIEADRNQFETALLNLSVNARDAMDGEGRLAISVFKADKPAEAEAPHGYVAIRLSDTGRGIERERIAQIFEPFFTTKDVGKGTGLGLSQVYGFVKQSGGDIEVESEPGQGATFTLYLAGTDGRPDSPAMAMASGEDREHRGCILLVEDNEQVGGFSTDLLKELGYDTIWAADAEAALARLKEDPDRFDLIFSDVVMPGMSGLELAAEVAQRWPQLPVVLTSGYSHVLAQDGSHGYELLRKPYSLEDLAATLANALTGASSPA